MNCKQIVQWLVVVEEAEWNYGKGAGQALLLKYWGMTELLGIEFLVLLNNLYLFPQLNCVGIYLFIAGLCMEALFFCVIL